jgi:general secretion pathway protein G
MNRQDNVTRPHRRRRRRPAPGTAGLTLIEILVVVTILGIIASIVGIQVANQLEEAKVDTARIQLSEITKSLDLYKVKFHRYPTTAEGLNSLTNPPKGRAPIMGSVPKDPWDNDYVYTFPGQHNTGKFDLQSKGPDGVADSEDDVTNW